MSLTSKINFKFYSTYRKNIKSYYFTIKQSFKETRKTHLIFGNFFQCIYFYARFLVTSLLYTNTQFNFI